MRAKIIMEGRELCVFFVLFFFSQGRQWRLLTFKQEHKGCFFLAIRLKKGRNWKIKNPFAFHLSHYVPNCCPLSLLVPTRPSRSCEDNLSLQRCSNMADGANYQGSHARASRSVINPPPPSNTRAQDIVMSQRLLMQL